MNVLITIWCEHGYDGEFSVLYVLHLASEIFKSWLISGVCPSSGYNKGRVAPLFWRKESQRPQCQQIRAAVKS